MTVDTAEKLAFLRSLAAYDHVVECVETHMSWVFLTGRRAFKLKKPVRLPYLDHSTLERRRQSCENELRLGRRLGATVYEGVAPIVASPRGLAIGGDGEGEIVDWLVVMRRLPADRMLPPMLARGAATPADADAIGDLLAGFYRASRPASWSGAEYRRRLRDEAAAVAAELVARGAPGARVGRLAQAQLDAIAREARALDARIAAGRVVEAHGDLRPEHVCLEVPPVVIDPLEFNDDLRTLDTASELAFFALECERLGAAWFGERVIERHAGRAGDRVPPPLAALYRSLHALTRALLALRHLDDAPPADHAKWHARAGDYLARADAARDPDRPPRAVTPAGPAPG
jgi:aminoglycoside phosphotransferase family enzyme